MGRVSIKRGGKKGLEFGFTFFFLSRSAGCRSPRSLRRMSKNPEASNPCASMMPFTESMVKPLADEAILDEALRFQGTLSRSRSSWGKGPSSFSTPWVMDKIGLGVIARRLWFLSGEGKVIPSWEGKCWKLRLT